MRIVLLALLLCVSSARAQEVPAWFTETFLDFREDLEDATREGRRLMVYFGQNGCPYCKQLMEVNFKQPAIVDKVQRNFVALAINIWGDREITWMDERVMTEKEFAAMMKVQFTPTVLFFDERGGVLLRMNGYYPPHRFEAALDYVAGRMEKKMRFSDYVQANPGEAAADKLADEPFFLKSPKDLRRKLGAKPLAVLFETVSCALCDEMHREAFKRAEVLAEIEKFDVVRFTPSETMIMYPPAAKRRARLSDWARSLNVGYAPTLVLFDTSGKEVFRIEAYVRPFHLAGALEYVSSGAYKSEPSFQRFLQSKTESLLKRGSAVDLWN